MISDYVLEYAGVFSALPKILIKWKDKTQNRHSSDTLNAAFSFFL